MELPAPPKNKKKERPLERTQLCLWRQAMVAPGAIYSLCWCNGTESSCAFEKDFRVRLGAMHMAGPSALQQARPRKGAAGKAKVRFQTIFCDAKGTTT